MNKSDTISPNVFLSPFPHACIAFYININTKIFCANINNKCIVHLIK